MISGILKLFEGVIAGGGQVPASAPGTPGPTKRPMAGSFGEVLNGQQVFTGDESAPVTPSPLNPAGGKFLQPGGKIVLPNEHKASGMVAAAMQIALSARAGMAVQGDSAVPAVPVIDSNIPPATSDAVIPSLVPLASLPETSADPAVSLVAALAHAGVAKPGELAQSVNPGVGQAMPGVVAEPFVAQVSVSIDPEIIPQTSQLASPVPPPLGAAQPLPDPTAEPTLVEKAAFATNVIKPSSEAVGQNRLGERPGQAVPVRQIAELPAPLTEPGVPVRQPVGQPAPVNSGVVARDSLASLGFTTESVKVPLAEPGVPVRQPVGQPAPVNSGVVARDSLASLSGTAASVKVPLAEPGVSVRQPVDQSVPAFREMLRQDTPLVARHITAQSNVGQVNSRQENSRRVNPDAAGLVGLKSAGLAAHGLDKTAGIPGGKGSSTLARSGLNSLGLAMAATKSAVSAQPHGRSEEGGLARIVTENQDLQPPRGMSSGRALAPGVKLDTPVLNTGQTYQRVEQAAQQVAIPGKAMGSENMPIPPALTTDRTITSIELPERSSEQGLKEFDALGKLMPTGATLATASGEVGLSGARKALGNAPLTVPMGDPNWNNAFVGRMKMLVNSDIQYANIQLNPPDLGKVDIKISSEGDQTKVLFIVQNATAREAIEQAMPRLKESLEQGGLQLAHSEVADQSQSQRHEGSIANELADFTVAGSDEESLEKLSQNRHVPASDALVDYYI